MKGKPHIRQARFVVSSADYRQCPKTNQSEFALIGRSNVGKSSLINALLERKSLAMVSGRPGKTQLINHFLVNEQWYLVDLPGYGWAQVSKVKKEKWDKLVREYLLKRPNLTCVLVLIDARIPPQKIDLEFIQWLGAHQVPLALVFTKADKPNAPLVNSHIQSYQNILLQTWESLPPFFKTSSKTKNGREELWSFLLEHVQA